MTYEYPADPPLELMDRNFSSALSKPGQVLIAQVTSMRVIFMPIPDLQSPMADISLFFLSANDIDFVEPTDDSWYAAHVPLNVNAPGGNLSVYLRDDPTKKQKSLISWFSTAIAYSVPNLKLIVEILGRSSLTSRYKLEGGNQGPLPSNQWELEVQYWFSTALANLQMIMVDTATGPTDANLTPWLHRPQNREERLACRSQKIRSDSFASFSTLGLVILLSVGGLIIIISFFLEFLVEWIQRRKNLGIYQRLEWVTNDTLQLQRLAHEELGFGTWSRTAEDHPVTAPGEQLATLDISDPNHPKLASLAAKSEASSQEESGNNGSTESIEEGAPAAGINHTVTAMSSG
ncbi:MAG: hypothetical protein M1816_003623 [Peltula sp. TS41687]|nr:MAG: hypothetical protein M1816_003623 [Peltula sp. TS41687]